MAVYELWRSTMKYYVHIYIYISEYIFICLALIHKYTALLQISRYRKILEFTKSMRQVVPVVCPRLTIVSTKWTIRLFVFMANQWNSQWDNVAFVQYCLAKLSVKCGQKLNCTFMTGNWFKMLGWTIDFVPRYGSSNNMWHDRFNSECTLIINQKIFICL